MVGLLWGCGGTSYKNSNEGVQLSEREAYRYDKALAAVEQVELLYQQALSAPSQERIVALQEKVKSLKYNYNDEGMNLATIQHCDSLEMRIASCKERVLSIAEQSVSSTSTISLVDLHEQLLNERISYPLYLKKGEKLYCDVQSSSVLTAQLYNADTERLVKRYQKSKISDSLTISNTGIYLLELIPRDKQYVSMSLRYAPTDSSDIFNRPDIYSEQVECKKGEFGAVGIPGIVMKKCFEEPRKFTLRGQLKAAFSGNAIALVAVQVPAGATDILYSMRIATSESSRSEDGQFHDNLTRSYQRVKFLGLPLYEKSTSNGLLNTLLDDNRPIREEDAYCNMYVFRNQSQAKQFQDGTKSALQLNYDVDFSTVGSQSCNGRIPVNGANTIYLGFENERMRYANYLWVEVEAVVPNTIYYRTKYSVN